MASRGRFQSCFALIRAIRIAYIREAACLRDVRVPVLLRRADRPALGRSVVLRVARREPRHLSLRPEVSTVELLVPDEVRHAEAGEKEVPLSLLEQLVGQLCVASREGRESAGGAPLVDE